MEQQKQENEQKDHHQCHDEIANEEVQTQQQGHDGNEERENGIDDPDQTLTTFQDQMVPLRPLSGPFSNDDNVEDASGNNRGRERRRRQRRQGNRRVGQGVNDDEKQRLIQQHYSPTRRNNNGQTSSGTPSEASESSVSDTNSDEDHVGDHLIQSPCVKLVSSRGTDVKPTLMTNLSRQNNHVFLGTKDDIAQETAHLQHHYTDYQQGPRSIDCTTTVSTTAASSNPGAYRLPGRAPLSQASSADNSPVRQLSPPRTTSTNISQQTTDSHDDAATGTGAPATGRMPPSVEVGDLVAEAEIVLWEDVLEEAREQIREEINSSIVRAEIVQYNGRSIESNDDGSSQLQQQQQQQQSTSVVEVQGEDIFQVSRASMARAGPLSSRNNNNRFAYNDGVTTTSNRLLLGQHKRLSTTVDSSAAIATPTSLIPSMPGHSAASSITEHSIDGHNQNAAGIDLSSLGMYGREKEIQILQQRLEDSISTNQKQLVLVSGLAGTGKSKLVTSALQSKATKQHRGLFVTAKFDYNQERRQSSQSSAEAGGCIPYGPMVSACNDICQHILTLPSSIQYNWRQRVVDVLGRGELNRFLYMIPKLQETIPDTRRNSVTLPISSNHDPRAKLRLQHAFRAFFRLVTDIFTPLVLVFDDLQRADEDSLDLIQSLILDQNSHNVMIVGIFRSNEVVGDETLLANILSDLRERSGGMDGFSMEELAIGNLSSKATTEILTDLLSTKDEETAMKLADLCYQKTHGNPFFFIQYVSLLLTNQLLRRTEDQRNEASSWEWDESEIIQLTGATKNVVEMVQSRMHNLSQDARLLLKLAACLGSKFHKYELTLAWQDLCFGKENATVVLEETLFAFVKDGYIEVIGPTSYIWSHDKIQEAAIELIPQPERARFRRRIGSSLLIQLNENELEALLFVVTNLLNSTDTDDNQKNHDTNNVRMAELNLRASRKAESFSAFESAARYIRYGVNFLGSDRWENNSALSLELYSRGAEAEGFLGNIERMNAYCQEALAQDQIPLKDKLRVYNAQLDSMGNRGYREEDAISLCLEVLEKFGVTFPSSEKSIKFHLILMLARLKLARPKKVLEVSRMTNQENIQIVRILDKLTTYCYGTKHPLMPIAVFRLYAWTCKHGFHDYTPVSMAMIGVMLSAVLNDLQRGTDFAEQAILLLDKFQATTQAKTIMISHMLVLHWTRPAHEMLSPLLIAHEKGLKSGDIDSAMWAANGYLAFRYITGTALGDQAEELRMYRTKMADLKRDKPLNSMRIHYQVILNLIGDKQNNDPRKIDGSVISRQELSTLLAKDPLLAGKYPVMKGILDTYFGGHEEYALQAIELGGDAYHKLAAGNPNAILETFLVGFNCFASVGKLKSSNDKKFKRMGNRMISKIKGWIQQGNPNVVHYGKILDAEWAAVYLGRKSQSRRVVALYRDAISTSLKNGYVQDAALAGERLGLYQINILSEQIEGLKNLNKAVGYYRVWGAMAKVSDLEEQINTFEGQGQ